MHRRPGLALSLGDGERGRLRETSGKGGRGGETKEKKAPGDGVARPSYTRRVHPGTERQEEDGAQPREGEEMGEATEQGPFSGVVNTKWGEP